MYEVINIVTTTETYIANGVWTHNKAACPAQAKSETYNPIAVEFEGNYVPAYPFTVHITLNDFSTGCAYASITSPTSYTITSSPYPTYFTRTVTVRPYVANASNAVFTLTATVSDANGKTANNNYSNSYGPFTYTCLTPDTIIELFTGEQRALCDIEIGDELLSINQNTMGYEKTVVTHKDISTVSELYIINNGLLKCSNSHRHMIKRDRGWEAVESYALKVGDTMLTKNRMETKINKIDITK